MPSPFPTLAGWHDVFLEILNLLESKNGDDDNNDDNGRDNDSDNFYAARIVYRSTLLSLALSCRAFLDPALNKLWHDLDGIHPLLKLLPNYRRRDFAYSITGDIPSDAWTRLQMYATRVRDANVYLGDGFDPSAWAIILKQLQGQPLFPHVRTLRVGIRWDVVRNSLTPAQALASPSLRDLIIISNASHHPDRIAIALQEFAIKSPGLIRLSFLPHKVIHCESLMCLSQFFQLEQLLINTRSILDEDLLLVLAGLRSLTSLGASILLRDLADSRPLDFKDGFQNLTKLDLELHCQPAYLPRFFLAATMPHLKDISLKFCTHVADGFSTSLTSICQHIGPHTLTRLRVDLTDFSQPPQFLMDLLEPLLPFSNLEHLEFLFYEHLPLRDSDLERFARAWRKLRVLLLIQSEATLQDPNREPGSVECPTLNGLVALARGCLLLDCLCIPDLDVSALPPADSVPLLGYGPLDLCIHNLVGAEDGEHQLNVAVALDRLFPRLKLEFGIEGFAGCEDNPNPFLEDSENVSRLLRAMQVARKNYPGGV